MKRSVSVVPLPGPTSWLVALSLFLLSLTSADSRSGYPVTIQGIEARCGRSAAAGGGAILNRPDGTKVEAGYDFRLTFTLYIPDISSWSDSSIVVAGSLPDGVSFKTTVRRQDFSRTDLAHYWFTIEVRVMNLGWAHFVLASGSADSRSSLDDDNMRDVGKDVELQCPERQDSGN